MNDREKILALQEALKTAMSEWAGWLDEARGVHPMDTDDREKWLACEVLSLAWTNQALGGMGG